MNSAHCRVEFSLIEILIAVGVLAIGMMGIASLFPLAIRNNAVAVNTTTGASVGRTATLSLSHDAVDVGLLEEPGEDDTTGIVGQVTTSGVTHDLDGSPGQLHNALAGRTISKKRGFSLPAELDNTDEFGTQKISGVINAIDDRVWDGSVWRKTGRSWSAVLIPQDSVIDLSTTYTAQVAVWKNVDILGKADADYAANRFGNVRPTTDRFWGEIEPGDYVCRAKGNHPVGVWHRIEEIDPANEDLHLKSSLSSEVVNLSSTTDSGEILWVASRVKLISLYDCVIFSD